MDDCSGCKTSGVKGATIDGKMYCPNCCISMALGETIKKETLTKVEAHPSTWLYGISLHSLPPQVKKASPEHPPCVLCGKPSCAIEHDFKFDEERTRIDYHLCRKHFIDNQRLRLDKKSYFKIKEFAQGITFRIHDDFYTEKGRPVQPR